MDSNVFWIQYFWWLCCWIRNRLSNIAIGNPSGMYTKLRTVAAENNRDYAPQSLLLLIARATYLMVLFFTHIPFVVNQTINATPPERLQQHPLLFTTNHTDRTCFVWRLEFGTTSTSWSQYHFVAIGNPSGMYAKLRTVAASNNKDHAPQSLLLWLARATYI